MDINGLNIPSIVRTPNTMDIDGLGLPTNVRTPNTMDINAIGVPLDDEIALQPALFEVAQGVNENTYFGLQTGFNGSSTELLDSDLTYFQLQKGANGAGVELLNSTYFSLKKGLNGTSIENDYISFWNIVDESGNISTLNGTVTITSLSNLLDSYTINVTGGNWILYPWTDSNMNIIPQSIYFQSSTTNESGYIETTPNNPYYTLKIFYDTERQNINMISFGFWDRALSFAEIVHLNNNGSPNNPWDHLPIDSDRNSFNMKENLKVWHQLQNGSFYDSSGLKIINHANSLEDGNVTGFTDLNELNNNIKNNNNIK